MNVSSRICPMKEHDLAEVLSFCETEADIVNAIVSYLDLNPPFPDQDYLDSDTFLNGWVAVQCELKRAGYTLKSSRFKEWLARSNFPSKHYITTSSLSSLHKQLLSLPICPDF
jgi:hypothetical protein